MDFAVDGSGFRKWNLYEYTDESRRFDEIMRTIVQDSTDERVRYWKTHIVCNAAFDAAQCCLGSL